MKMNRRDFMKRTAGAVAATTVGMNRALAENPAGLPLPAAIQRRSLGKSGLACTRLGVGTGTRAWNKNSEQIRRGRDVFLNTLTHAWERGIRYYDLADMYGSHQFMRDAMKTARMQREELFILTKINAKTGKEVMDDLERIRTEINSDYLDVVLLHCMTSGAWPEKFAECRDALSEAQAKGIIRGKGVSCHHLQALHAAASHEWTDVILARINPFGTHMDGTQEEIISVLREARKNGKGVIGMKILGEGKHGDEKEKCIRFAMELDCLDAMTIGFLESRELDEIMALMNPQG